MKPIVDPFSPTPEGFHLRVEQTLNGLEERTMNRKIRLCAAVALAILLLAASAFAATQYLGGFIDWNGKFTPDEVQIAPTPQPDSENADELSSAEQEMANIPDGEVWTLLNPHPSRTVYAPYSVDDLSRFEKYLYGTVLRMPGLPEGMNLTEATLQTPAEPLPYEEIIYEDAVLQKYKMQPLFSGNAISYDLTFRSDDGGYLSITCSKEELSYEDLEIGVDSEKSFTMLDRERTGWDHGVYIQMDDGDAEIILQFVWHDCITHFSIYAHETTLTQDDLLALIPKI